MGLIDRARLAELESEEHCSEQDAGHKVRMEDIGFWSSGQEIRVDATCPYCNHRAGLVIKATKIGLPVVKECPTSDGQRGCGRYYLVQVKHPRAIVHSVPVDL